MTQGQHSVVSTAIMPGKLPADYVADAVQSRGSDAFTERCLEIANAINWSVVLLGRGEEDPAADFAEQIARVCTAVDLARSGKSELIDFLQCMKEALSDPSITDIINELPLECTSALFCGMWLDSNNEKGLHPLRQTCREILDFFALRASAKEVYTALMESYTSSMIEYSAPTIGAEVFELLTAVLLRIEHKRTAFVSSLLPLVQESLSNLAHRDEDTDPLHLVSSLCHLCHKLAPVEQSSESKLLQDIALKTLVSSLEVRKSPAVVQQTEAWQDHLGKLLETIAQLGFSSWDSADHSSLENASVVFTQLVMSSNNKISPPSCLLTVTERLRRALPFSVSLLRATSKPLQVCGVILGKILFDLEDESASLQVFDLIENFTSVEIGLLLADVAATCETPDDKSEALSVISLLVQLHKTGASKLTFIRDLALYSKHAKLKGMFLNRMKDVVHSEDGIGHTAGVELLNVWAVRRFLKPNASFIADLDVIQAAANVALYVAASSQERLRYEASASTTAFAQLRKHLLDVKAALRALAILTERDEAASRRAVDEIQAEGKVAGMSSAKFSAELASTSFLRVLVVLTTVERTIEMLEGRSAGLPQLPPQTPRDVR